MIPGRGYGFGRSLASHGYGTGLGSTPVVIDTHDGFDRDESKKRHKEKLKADIQQAWKGLSGNKEALELVPATSLEPIEYLMLDDGKAEKLLRMYQIQLDIERDDEDIFLLL